MTNLVKAKLIIKPGGKWYEYEVKESKNDSEEKKAFPKQNFQTTIKKSAEELFESDNNTYRILNTQGDNKSDFLWMEKMMKTGTVQDRMAAFIVRIQDSPIHNIRSLQHLISLVKAQGKQNCLAAADTLKDLFLEDLLPPNRKLINFNQRKSLESTSKKELVLWVFEDKLKDCYKDYVEALVLMSKDNIDKIRGKAILTIHKLLETHPELEEYLLQLLVNKLGDPIQKIASRALFHLNKLLEVHPNMKKVVIEEVERMIFRNNIASRAQYYGICFLSAIKLRNDPDLASKLIKIYLAFFKTCVNNGDVDSKLMNGLLTGLNRAFPCIDKNQIEFKDIDTLYRIVQFSHYNIGVQALSILYQITDIKSSSKEADRFYRVLYKKLLSPDFLTSAHNMNFLNITYQSIKKDISLRRSISFTKRLLQICHNAPPNLACSILYLLSEIKKINEGIFIFGDTLLKEEVKDENLDNDDDGEDKDEQKKIANITRNTNIQFDGPSVSSKPPSKPKKNKEKKILKNDKEEAKPDISIVIKEEEEECKLTEYDPINSRNPKFTGAEHSLTYELSLLTSHYHPSVAIFAKSLIIGDNITYNGNPLKDFTIARFLERFIYRNPKTLNNNKHHEYQPKGLRNMPVNSNEYLKTEEDEIPPEEKFFYRFFKERKSTEIKKEKVDDKDSDNESISDGEFDKFMDNYFTSKKGKKGDDEEEEEEEMESENDEEIDFASQKEKGNKKSSKRKTIEEEIDEISDDDDAEDMDFEDEEDNGDDFVDLDEANNSFEDEDNDDNDNDDEFQNLKSNINKKLKKSKFKAQSFNDELFAPAEQFSEMLESNAEMSLSGPHTFINKDNADVKQLKWETQRDRWAKGYNNKVKTRGVKRFKRKR